MHRNSWQLATTSALLAILCSSAQAQTMITAGINSPTYSQVDQNGVNLTSLRPGAEVADVSIGSKERPLSRIMRTDDGEGSSPAIRFTDSFLGKAQTPLQYDTSQYHNGTSPNCNGANSVLDVSYGGNSDRMCGTAGGTYAPERGGGSSMVTNGDGSLTYTEPDGTQRLYELQLGFRLLTRVTAPNGLITTLTYKVLTLSGGAKVNRLQSVTRNDGLQLKYTYASNVAPAGHPLGGWAQVSKVTGINNAFDYCDPTADSCATTQTWPFATQTWTTSGSLKYMTLVDAGGRATRFTTGIPVLSGGIYQGQIVNFTGDQLLAIRAPTSPSADTVTYTYCAVSGEFFCMHSGVKKVTIGGYEWTYPGTSANGGISLIIIMTATRPVGGNIVTTQQRGDSSKGPLYSIVDGIALRTFYFDTSLANRLSRVVLGDGDRLDYAYDGRGNITRETHTPASGSALLPTVRTAGYSTTCLYAVKCNRPNWVRDAKLNQTDYLYSINHGGVLSEALPPDNAGVRPQTRYTYTQRYAWYKNSSGTVVRAATPVWLLTAEKFCRKTATLEDRSGCSGGALDEVATTYDYGPTTGANNLFLRGKAVTADGTTRRTCYGNDIYGNRVSETLPKAGLSSCP